MGIKKPDTSEVPGSGAGFVSHPGDCVRALSSGGLSALGHSKRLTALAGEQASRSFSTYVSGEGFAPSSPCSSKGVACRRISTRLRQPDGLSYPKISPGAITPRGLSVPITMRNTPMGWRLRAVADHRRIGLARSCAILRCVAGFWRDRAPMRCGRELWRSSPSCC